MGQAFQGFEHGRVGAQELLHRDAVHALHFGGIGHEHSRRTGPHHNGRDDVTRTRGVVVEPPEDVLFTQHQTQLLAQFTQCRGLRRFTRVDSATRQRPLAGMRTHRGCTQREQHGGAVAGLSMRRQAGEFGAMGFLDQGQRDGSAARRPLKNGPHLEACQVLQDRRLERSIAPDRRRIQLQLCWRAHLTRIVTS